MNPTIEKFGFPETLIREFEHWVILFRPAQVTLGSLVLAAKSDATAYSELPREAFTEQLDAVQSIGSALSAFCQYERINYLMLMMVDPNVHFHVIPRYSVSRQWRGIEFPDRGWPGLPQLGQTAQLSPTQMALLRDEMAVNFR
jgi:diadenosine tetraphosphate (Ap4A) HIT family hydrolase